ncbi:hypothetical protein [Serratia odorifera]|uniref:hypothetical protein n=1 Tax=Serratia odorifera TaxID=618 RepID=UPI0024111833|nr:hypothetical protein [Serratia odorifera]
MLTSVKKAEQYLLENETTKNYLGIEGHPGVRHLHAGTAVRQRQRHHQRQACPHRANARRHRWSARCR